MNHYKTFSDIKDKAKEHLTGRFNSAAIANLLPSLFTSSVTFTISMLFTNITTIILMLQYGDGAANIADIAGFTVISSILMYLVSQLVGAIMGVFNTGIALYFLNISCGRKAKINHLFYGFQHIFKRSLTVSTVSTLVNTLCLLPYNVFLILYQTNSSTTWLICTAVSLVLGGLIYLPISLSLSQCHFLLLDFPKYSGSEVIRLSMRIMKGKKLKLFLLQLSFLPLHILGLLSFGIGSLWVTPYTNMTMALYFLDIMNPTSNTENLQ